jgi:hypothetical protein
VCVQVPGSGLKNLGRQDEASEGQKDLSFGSVSLDVVNLLRRFFAPKAQPLCQSGLNCSTEPWWAKILNCPYVVSAYCKSPIDTVVAV